MGVVLGEHSYGKAETHVVRVVRHGSRHEIRDLTVSTALQGDFAESYTTGDQSRVLPTDSQKNTVFAFAGAHGVGAPEDFALDLARHFVRDLAPVRSARVEAVEQRWSRVVVDGRPHEHAFCADGAERRTATVTVTTDGEWVVSGLSDLVLLKSSGSEFAGFLTDEYTTLEPTADRVLATSLVARWCWAGTEHDWDAAYGSVREILVERFATVHSLALQQSLWEMGRAVLERYDEVLEVRLSAPNRHHHLVDLRPFGLDNPGEVYWAADRPYGRIEAEVRRDDGPDTSAAWRTVPGFA